MSIFSLFRRLDDLSYQIAELHRRLAAIVQVGTVKSFDPKAGAVLDVGYQTHNVPVGWHAGSGADWAPLKAGQQITFLCPSGDPANGFVLPGGFHNSNPAPSQSGDEDIRAQRNGNRLRTTDAQASLENANNKTAVNAAKNAELTHADGAAVRAMPDQIVHLEVASLAKLKIIIGGQSYVLVPQAVTPG
jgi:phage baseplate assembly protein gpV